ncbi:MAG: CRISPR-associated endonuclease Cas1 [Methanoregulaceae archaeon]
MSNSLNWLTILGRGAHIKATPVQIIIQRDETREEYKITDYNHVLIVGRHTLHADTIRNLAKAGCQLSFFDTDGEPLGYLKPYGKTENSQCKDQQKAAQPHRYAVEIAKSSIKSRIRAIQLINERFGSDFLLEGELALFQSMIEELEYLVKLSEVRRVHQLSADMYYEFMARGIPRILGFKRRTGRPYLDPINAILSFGYAMLFGNCQVSIIGARLDPDTGMLHDGPGGLVYDLMEPFKAVMIDDLVFREIGRSLSDADYVCGTSRCILSDTVMKQLISRFRMTIDQKKIDMQVSLLLGAFLDENEIQIIS